MRPIKEAASEFLANKRVAVTGVSNANARATKYCRRLRERGYRGLRRQRTPTRSGVIRCYKV